MLAFVLLDYFALRTMRSLEWDQATLQVLMIPIVMLEAMLLQIPLFYLNSRWLFEEKVSDGSIWRATARGMFSMLLRIVIPYFIQLTILAPTVIALWNVLIRGFYRPEVLYLEGLRGKDLRTRLGSLTSALQVLTFWVFHIILFFVFTYLCIVFLENVMELIRLENYDIYVAYSMASPAFIFLILLYSIFFAVSRFLFYVDARTALEGWDLELQFIRGLDEMTSQKRIS